MKEAGVNADDKDSVIAFRLHMNRLSFLSSQTDISST